MLDQANINNVGTLELFLKKNNIKFCDPGKHSKKLKVQTKNKWKIKKEFTYLKWQPTIYF